MNTVVEDALRISPRDKPVDYAPSLTMDRPKKPGWLKKGAEGLSVLVREKLAYHDPKVTHQAKRAAGWVNDPSPDALMEHGEKPNLRPSKMPKGKTAKDQSPWQYKATDVHKSALTDPMHIPRPGLEYKKPRPMAKTNEASEGSLSSFRGKSTADPDRLYS